MKLTEIILSLTRFIQKFLKLLNFIGGDHLTNSQINERRMANEILYIVEMSY